MKCYDETGKEYNIRDDKEIARGGEGRIIELTKTSAAKIYHDGRDPLSKQRHQDLAVLSCPPFVKPETLLYDIRKKLVGFVMSLLPTDSFPIFSAYNSMFCTKNLLDDNWKVIIINKLIAGTEEAHRHKIVIGDFNGFNIMSYRNTNLFFIDVDSFETPNHKHSGILFDEVRDHLFHGNVSVNSDYFCLAVMSFNLLTYVHPFKGVHKTYRTISDRMIFKVPVFDNDKDLIVPKCYKPIADQFLMDQFVKIFKNGERFPIQLVRTTMLRKTVASVAVTVETVDLIMKEIHTSNDIMYIKASNTKLCVVEKDKITVFNTLIKSVYNIDFQIQNTHEYLELFVTDQYVFGLKKDSIGIINKNGSYIKLEEFIGEVLSYNQYENILCVIFEDKIRRFYLDNVIISVNSIKNTSDNIYGKSFTKYNGLVQNVNGNYYMFYNGQNVLNTVLFGKTKLHDVIQSENFGIAEYFENKSIKYGMFYIDGLSIRLDGTDLGINKKFGYKKDQFVVMPDNDVLTFYRPSDFSSIAKYECKVINEDSEIYLTTAGIIARTDNKIFLINKK